MTASSETLPVESLLEILERERGYYERLRELARKQREALGRGQLAQAASLLSEAEPEVQRAHQATLERMEREAATADSGDPALKSARASAATNLRLFAVENSQNLASARGRLEEIHLTLGVLGAADEKPSYPGAAAPSKPNPLLLDRRA